MDYQKRVIQEKEDLDLKIKALQKFVEDEENTVYKGLSVHEKSDLKEQLKYMQDYAYILQKRINRF